ncbi:MAG: DMT family protein [Bacteroidaceae bacterium]|nr:DMT family protein [Bacteroidaceae bacterium]MBQ8676153.1 DMT family protein [Bacteroidaceae bacterium]MBQ9176709.1 DMT family protein [Bacteroidaceae bacterium]MBR1378309.1 DMT family protein [Bacteroidaceae bacterium]
MKGTYTILLLIASNTLMTFAWYGNLLLRQHHISDSWPMPLVVLLSWLVAGLEYCFLIPANSIGSDINGGPYSLMQLKVIQEVISISVFTVIAMMCFQGQHLHWNHIAAFLCLVGAVCFVFWK